MADQEKLTWFIEILSSGFEDIIRKAQKMDQEVEKATRERTVKVKSDAMDRQVQQQERALWRQHEQEKRASQRLYEEKERSEARFYHAQERRQKRWEAEQRRAAQQYHRENAPGAEKHEMSSVERFGIGESLRRVVSRALTDAFGGGAMGAILGGSLGILAGSTLLRLGWIIGDAVMNIPKTIGEQVDIYRYAKNIGYRDKAGTEDWRGFTGAGRFAWAGYTYGKDKTQADQTYTQLLLDYQAAGSEDKSLNAKMRAAEAANVSTFLAVGGVIPDPRAFNMAYAEMLKTGSGASKQALMQEPWLAQKMYERFKDRPMFARMTREAAMDLMQKAAGAPEDSQMARYGWAISSEDIIQAVRAKMEEERVYGAVAGQGSEWRFRRAVTGPRGIELWRDPGELTERERDFMSHAGRAGSAAERAKLVEKYKRPVQKSPGFGSMPFSGPAPEEAGIAEERLWFLAQYARDKNITQAVPGLGKSFDTAHDIYLPKQYQFTTGAGLAETMQMMWSGGANDWQATTAGAVTEIRDMLRANLPNNGMPRNMTNTYIPP